MKECKPDRDRRTVSLDLSEGENVVYEITVTGARGVFSIVDQKGRVILKPDQDDPQTSYRRRWPRDDDAVDVQLHVHLLAMSFFQATRYDLVIEHRDGSGNVLEVLKDCEFASTDPSEWDVEPFKILV